MPVDPSVLYGPSLYPGAGWLRTAIVGGVPAILDNWDIQVPNEYVMKSRMVPLPAGPKQRILHARGTSEVTFDLRGDLTVEGSSLIMLLDPSQRGLTINVLVQQYGVVDLLTSCYWDHFSLMGQPGQPVKFALRGRSTSYPTEGGAFPFADYQHLVPAWATGNDFVESWEITHSVGLSPVWWNSQDVLPAYYRPAESDYMMRISTVYQLTEYDTISLGIGAFTITGLVRSRGVVSAGRDVRVYTVEILNVDTSGQNPTSAGGAVAVTDPTFQGAPDGI